MSAELALPRLNSSLRLWFQKQPGAPKSREICRSCASSSWTSIAAFDPSAGAIESGKSSVSQDAVVMMDPSTQRPVLLGVKLPPSWICRQPTWSHAHARCCTWAGVRIFCVRMSDVLTRLYTHTYIHIYIYTHIYICMYVYMYVHK